MVDGRETVGPDTSDKQWDGLTGSPNSYGYSVGEGGPFAFLLLGCGRGGDKPPRYKDIVVSYKYGQCSAITKLGVQCPTGKMVSGEYCHVHEPRIHNVGIAIVGAGRYEVAYREYLKSARWKQKRQKRLEIDNYQCVSCGSCESLEIHHVIYSRLGWEMMSDLRTLCRSCHQAITDDELAYGREKANDKFRTRRARKNRQTV